MAKIGTFKINSSFKLRGRGLVAIGQIVEGVVKIGAYTNFDIGNNRVNVQISGVEMVDINREKGEYGVGLTFVYKDEIQQKEFETMKLNEQIIEIIDEPVL
jgi:translation elongation factor EF-Tu-like GTPase